MNVTLQPVATVATVPDNVCIVMSKKEASILREIVGDLRPVEVVRMYKEQTGLDVRPEDIHSVLNLYDYLQKVL